MFEKLVEIILSKYLQIRTPEAKADRRVKESIVFLHEALVRCQNAYYKFESEPSVYNFYPWLRAFQILSQMIMEIYGILAVYVPEYERILIYGIAESNYLQESRIRLMVETDGGEISTYQIHEEKTSIFQEDDELQELERVASMLRDERTPLRVDAEFEEAVIKLRGFMKEHITMGEIYKAQKTFQKRFSP